MIPDLYTVLTAINALYHGLPLPWQIAVFLTVAAVGVCIGLVAADLFASLVMAISSRRARRVHQPPAPIPFPVNADRCHNTYCRSCEHWDYLDVTACPTCATALLIYPDDPIPFAHAMAETYPLPTPRSFEMPASKGFRLRIVTDDHDERIHRLIRQQRRVQ